MEYCAGDMSKVKRWLNIYGKEDGWKIAREKEDIQIWQNENNGQFYQIVVTENQNYEEYMLLPALAISAISKAKKISEEECYRIVMLNGIILDDVSPFKTDKYEGLVLKWSADIGFGEYTIYRKLNDSMAKWEADSDDMDGSQKRYLKELMKQYVNQIDI